MKYHTLFFETIGKMLQNLPSAAVVIDALRVNVTLLNLLLMYVGSLYFAKQYGHRSVTPIEQPDHDSYCLLQCIRLTTLLRSLF